jgi:hypothetical protein
MSESKKNYVCTRSLMDETNYIYGRTYELPESFAAAHREHFAEPGSLKREDQTDEDFASKAAAENRKGQERFEAIRDGIDKQNAELAVALARQELEEVKDLQRQREEALRQVVEVDKATPAAPVLHVVPPPPPPASPEPVRESRPGGDPLAGLPRAERLRRQGG